MWFHVRYNERVVFCLVDLVRCGKLSICGQCLQLGVDRCEWKAYFSQGTISETSLSFERRVCGQPETYEDGPLSRIV